MPPIPTPEPLPPAHAYGLTETDDVVKTVSYLFLLGICKDHNSGEKLIICKDSEFSCSQVSFLFFYLFIQVENVLKMITVYENFDFLHIFPVMGEIYYYVTIVYRVIEVPKANYSKYARVHRGGFSSTATRGPDRTKSLK